jgi:hypothetical protein
MANLGAKEMLEKVNSMVSCWECRKGLHAFTVCSGIEHHRFWYDQPRRSGICRFGEAESLEIVGLLPSVHVLHTVVVKTTENVVVLCED